MIFMGHFIHATNQEEVEEADRRHGEFNLVVEADRADRALERFRQRVIEYRENSSFFEGECSIYLVQLLEFDRFPSQSAMMINYKSTAGDPVMPFIGCTVPSGDTDGCRVFDWDNNNPAVDGESEKLFLKFGPGETCEIGSLPDASSESLA